MIRRSWPEWWSWELELNSHVLRRMIDRGFTEVDLRSMLHRASGFREDLEPGRWVIETRHRRRAWNVIVEPEAFSRLLVVITAFPVD